MNHNTPPSHEDTSPPADETQLDGLLTQTQMAVEMGGQATYVENENGERTAMLPSRNGAEVFSMAPGAAAKLRLTPDEEVNIAFTPVTSSGGSSALIEVVPPFGEDYKHYFVEKVPVADGAPQLTGTYIDTAFNQLKRARDMELGDFEKFPIEGDLTTEKVREGAIKPTSQEEVEAGKSDQLPDIPVTDEAGQALLAAGEGRPLTVDQVNNLGEVIGALTHIPPAQPEA